MTTLPMSPPQQPVETDTPLWKFSVSLWKDPHAERAALELQTAGWAVSHLLVGAWLAREGFLWDGQEPEEIQRWRLGVIENLRALRSALAKDRTDLQALRLKIAQAELESERVELGWWYQWLDTHPLPRTPNQQPSRLLAENLLAARVQVTTQQLDLLGRFGQALIPSQSLEAFSQELRSVLGQPGLRS